MENVKHNEQRLEKKIIDCQEELLKLQKIYDDVLNKENDQKIDIKDNGCKDKLVNCEAELFELQKTHEDTINKQKELLKIINDNKSHLKDKLIQQNRELQDKYNDDIIKIEEENNKTNFDLQKSHGDIIIRLQEKHKVDLKRNSNLELSLLESCQEKMDQSSISVTS